MSSLLSYFNLLALILIVFCAVGPAAAIPYSPGLPINAKFENLEAAALETIGDVKAIVQDEQGFMWFGGYNGLVRYDGYDMKMFRHREGDETSLNNNHVHSLFKDSKGRLWISTDRGVNLYHPETEDFSQYTAKLTKWNNDHTYASRVFEDGSGELWVTTYSHGLNRLDPAKPFLEPVPLVIHGEKADDFNAMVEGIVASDGNIWLSGYFGLLRYNPETQHTRYFKHHPDDPSGLSENFVRCLYEDHQGLIWVGLDNSLNRIDPTTEKITRFAHEPDNPFTVSSGGILDIYQDAQQNIWIATSTLLNVYDSDTQQFYRFESKYPDDGSITQAHVRGIYQDASGGMWFGTFPYGVFRQDRYRSSFGTYKRYPRIENSLSDKHVMAAAVTPEGNLWVGTGGGLNFIDRKTQKITHYRHDPDDPRSLPIDSVTALALDAKNRLWVGNFDRGISRFVPPSVPGEVGHFIRYNIEELGHYTKQTVYSFYLDRQGQLWAGVQTGLARFDESTDSFIYYGSDQSNDRRIGGERVASGLIRSMLETSDGEFWLGGADKLCLMDRATIQFQCFEHDPDNPNSIRSGSIRKIAESKNGLWIGLLHGGLNFLNRKTGHFEAYGIDDGLPDNNIIDIQEDKNGFLWLATQRGLSKFNPKQKIFTNYDSDHGIAGNSNTAVVTQALTGDEIIFAGNNGVTTFTPDKIYRNSEPPRPALTNLHLLNRSVVPGEPGSILTRAIAFTNEIILSHQQSVFSIEYVGLNYELSARNQYAYILEGFDKDWHFVGAERKATYTNIDPGRYTFRVRAANSEGVWSKTDTTIDIRILPPWWRTWWAYSFYMLLGILFLASIVYSLWNKKLAFVAETEKRIRMQFFASMSHEIRTPLTVIKGYAELLAAKVSPGTEIAGQSRAIVDGANDLTDIVSEILDLSKIESGKFTVSPVVVDLPILLIGLRETLTLMVRKKNIEVRVSLQSNVPQHIVTDPLRLKQILMNLFANAVKFTETGSIAFRVSCTKEKGLLILEVEDTGIGMNQEQSNKLFSAFTQADDDISRSYGGTGLGLFISKQFSHYLGGDLTLKSEEGKGSCFTVSIATGDLANANWLSKLPMNGIERINVTKELIPAQVSNLRGRVLYAEDNENNQVLVRGMLESTNIDLTLVDNGLEAMKAIEKAELEKPFDLVLTDFRMPVMDGVALAKTLKSKNINLPLIAVTANFSDLAIDEYNQLGFDGFIEKPFDKQQFYDVITPYLKTDDDGSSKSHGGLDYAEIQALPTVLIVDDNAEVRHFIQQALAGTFRCYLAEDVERGQAIALTHVPDLIISDLMMPNTDGFQFAEFIRGDIRTSHIPIVMLTAKSDDETRKLAWQSQLDDFIAKPFSAEELILRCNNLLGIRQLLSRRLSSLLEKEELEAKPEAPDTEQKSTEKDPVDSLELLNASDKVFIDKLSSYVADNYNNEDLSTHEISEHLAMSDRQLRRKIKATLDQSVTDFIRAYRLRKGADFLKQGFLTSEVAFKVGFSSASYFSTCFKSHYGIAPKHYLKSCSD